MDITIRIAGEAGQGLQTTGDLLVRVFTRLGLHVFSTQSYLSRIRGGLNWCDIRIEDKELFSGREQADLLVALNKDALDELRDQVTEGGMILFNGSAESGILGVDFSAIAKELVGSAVMANSVAAGAIIELLGYDIEELCRFLEVTFKKKGDEIIQNNVKCARQGAAMVSSQAGHIAAPKPTGSPECVCTGGEALGLGAATAGVSFATAYPMTPGTAVLTYLAGVSDEYGITVEQAEDEIAAVNMVCGAVYAGAVAMTTTSGGGFALMTEGVSLAGMMELPIVIHIAQRPGPATGLPTRTAQQDLKMVLYAGHGEFPRAIYTPGTLRQAYDLMRRAFETAHKYQSPVFILSDEFLVDIQKNIEPLDKIRRPIVQYIVEEAGPDYQRYTVTPDGISPRAVPGGEALVICDSDEHSESGHITEDLAARIRQQDKRMAKGKGILAEVIPPEVYGPAEATHLLVCWGSTYGPCREAVDRLNSGEPNFAMVHFSQVWPIDVEKVKKILTPQGLDSSLRKITFVEGNVTAQMASVLREQGIHLDCDTLLRYDGMPFSGEEIARRIEK